MHNKTLEKWEEKTLDDVCKINYGTRVVKSRDAGTIYPVYGGGGATFSMNTFNREDCMVVARFAMSERCTRFVKGKFFLNDSGLTVETKISNLNQNFIDWQLISLNDKIYSLGRGSAQKNLNVDLFKKIQIKYPTDVEEQQRIVGILDEAFENIDKAKQNALQNLNNAKELFESTLNNLLSKEYPNNKKLGDICKITSKLTDPKLPQNQNLLHVGAANIEQKNGTLINLMSAKEEKLISNKFIFNEKMVLYSKIRPYLMKVVRPNFTGLCSADIYPLLPDTNYITRDYLFYLLLSKSFTEYAIEGSARAGMPKVNRPHLFAYTCNLPKIEEQQKIVAQLDELQEQTKKLEQIYEQKIKDLDELKQSILQKAFNGEL